MNKTDHHEAPQVKLRGEYPDKLTHREKEVVLLLCLGLKESAAARMLGICPATVHSHITRVHRKLGVTSRGRLVACAIVNGIVCIDELAEALRRTADCDCRETF